MPLKAYLIFVAFIRLQSSLATSVDLEAEMATDEGVQSLANYCQEISTQLHLYRTNIDDGSVVLEERNSDTGEGEPKYDVLLKVETEPVHSFVSCAQNFMTPLLDKSSVDEILGSVELEAAGSACRVEPESTDPLFALSNSIEDIQTPTEQVMCEASAQISLKTCARNSAYCGLENIGATRTLGIEKPEGAECSGITESGKSVAECMGTIIRGVFNGLTDTLKLLVVDGPRWIYDRTFGSWFGEPAVDQLENVASIEALESANETDEELTQEQENPEESFLEKAARIAESVILDGAVRNFGCETWSSGVVGIGSCLNPPQTWECSSCKQKSMALCGAAGFTTGMIIEGAVLATPVGIVAGSVIGLSRARNVARATTAVEAGATTTRARAAAAVTSASLSVGRKTASTLAPIARGGIAVGRGILRFLKLIPGVSATAKIATAPLRAALRADDFLTSKAWNLSYHGTKAYAQTLSKTGNTARAVIAAKTATRLHQVQSVGLDVISSQAGIRAHSAVKTNPQMFSPELIENSRLQEDKLFNELPAQTERYKELRASIASEDLIEQAPLTGQYGQRLTEVVENLDGKITAGAIADVQRARSLELLASSNKTDQLKAIEELRTLRFDQNSFTGIPDEKVSQRILAVMDSLADIARTSPDSELRLKAIRAVVEYSRENSQGFKTGTLGYRSPEVIGGIYRNYNLPDDVRRVAYNGIRETYRTKGYSIDSSFRTSAQLRRADTIGYLNRPRSELSARERYISQNVSKYFGNLSNKDQRSIHRSMLANKSLIPDQFIPQAAAKLEMNNFNDFDSLYEFGLTASTSNGRTIYRSSRNGAEIVIDTPRTGNTLLRRFTPEEAQAVRTAITEGKRVDLGDSMNGGQGMSTITDIPVGALTEVSIRRSLIRLNSPDEATLLSAIDELAALKLTQESFEGISDTAANTASMRVVDGLASLARNTEANPQVRLKAIRAAVEYARKNSDNFTTGFVGYRTPEVLGAIYRDYTLSDDIRRVAYNATRAAYESRGIKYDSSFRTSSQLRRADKIDYLNRPRAELSRADIYTSQKVNKYFPNLSNKERRRIHREIRGNNGVIPIHLVNEATKNLNITNYGGLHDLSTFGFKEAKIGKQIVYYQADTGAQVVIGAPTHGNGLLRQFTPEEMRAISTAITDGNKVNLGDSMEGGRAMASIASPAEIPTGLLAEATMRRNINRLNSPIPAEQQEAIAALGSLRFDRNSFRNMTDKSPEVLNELIFLSKSAQDQQTQVRAIRAAVEFSTSNSNNFTSGKLAVRAPEALRNIYIDYTLPNEVRRVAYNAIKTIYPQRGTRIDSAFRTSAQLRSADMIDYLGKARSEVTRRDILIADEVEEYFGNLSNKERRRAHRSMLNNSRFPEDMFPQALSRLTMRNLNNLSELSNFGFEFTEESGKYIYRNPSTGAQISIGEPEYGAGMLRDFTSSEHEAIKTAIQNGTELDLGSSMTTP
jgi:uncharacterized protein (UPF0147 family)